MTDFIDIEGSIGWQREKDSSSFLGEGLTNNIIVTLPKRTSA